jgi:hypothetical protein
MARIRMNSYASNTHNRWNLAALRAAGWRILISPDRRQEEPPPEFRFAIDNGAWRAFKQMVPFDGAAFQRLIDKHGAGADFVVIPDIVAGGKRSMEFSLSWLERLRHLRLLLFAVQDGMTADEVGSILRRNPGLGIFLGGSTEWKLRTIYAWGMVAHALGCYYHVGRVNTRRRIRLCAEAGAHSFDGSSASIYSCTLPLLDSARKQPSLLTPGAL